jgi:hypothetical protein
MGMDMQYEQAATEHGMGGCRRLRGHAACGGMRLHAHDAGPWRPSRPAANHGGCSACLPACLLASLQPGQPVARDCQGVRGSNSPPPHPPTLPLPPPPPLPLPRRHGHVRARGQRLKRRRHGRARPPLQPRPRLLRRQRVHGPPPGGHHAAAGPRPPPAHQVLEEALCQGGGGARPRGGGSGLWLAAGDRVAHQPSKLVRHSVSRRACHSRAAAGRPARRCCTPGTPRGLHTSQARHNAPQSRLLTRPHILWVPRRCWWWVTAAWARPRSSAPCCPRPASSWR